MGRNVLIIGFKRSGISAAKLFHFLGDGVYVCDRSEIRDIPEWVKGDRNGLMYDELFEGIGLVVLSPSVDIKSEMVCEAQKRNIAVIGETEGAYRVFNGRVTAVTGTNGKTTTTSLIEAFYLKGGKKAAALGNIGIPFSEFIKKDIDEAVLEVSSFQLESTRDFKPHIALFLNFAPDHLDRHKDLEEYYSAKVKIFQNQTSEDFAVINADDEILFDRFKDGITPYALGLSSDVSERFQNRNLPRLYTFSAKRKTIGAYVEKEGIFFDDGAKTRRVCSLSDGKLKGAHNLENVLAAITAACLSDIENTAVINALSEFQPAHARIEFVKKIEETSFFNDSKGTNIHASIAAAKAMTGSTALILGGSDKGEDFRVLFRALPDNIISVYVTGENASKIIEAAGEFPHVKICGLKTLKECVKKAYEERPKNVLLSPASASFDRYKNYEERGVVFEKLVEEL
ncbi:MAG: UDP-N-acetylmuramoyl-L-alanine--D-glutamate ligase [Clostridiales bacterium]|jgi:UDP-N-acetylmuramoylalanine--D-glutamate ligase|nr:UDP-N-acetylmuramoyl-L-alanine--D-glutamate ligase [Clostridiales bacterium]